MGKVASQAGSFRSWSSAIRRSGSEPSGPCEGSSSSPIRLSSSSTPAALAEVRHERVQQHAGHVVDVERVADLGERVVEHQPAHERGVDEAFFPVRGNAEQGERGQAGAGGTHRMDGHYRLSRRTVARVDREHGAALTIGPDRLEQAGYRGGAVGLPGGVRIGLAAGRRELDELRAQQVLRLARQDRGGVPVVLHDAPVVIDPEDQGPNGRRHDRMRTLGGTAFDGRASGRGLRGFGDPGLLEVRAGLGSAASLGSVTGSPRQRGAVHRDTTLGSIIPESGALRRHAGCHVRSPDGIAGCAPVNYEPRTARSDGSSDDSPLSLKVTFYALLTEF